VLFAVTAPTTADSLAQSGATTGAGWSGASAGVSEGAACAQPDASASSNGTVRKRGTDCFREAFISLPRAMPTALAGASARRIVPFIFIKTLALI
jgi:hypothetical protein